MSDTPRTDSMLRRSISGHIPVYFARELEREIARVTEERDTERQTKEAAGRELLEAASQMRSLRADLAQRTAERDEARQEVCYGYGPMAESLAAAKRRGWDCFKEAQP